MWNHIAKEHHKEVNKNNRIHVNHIKLFTAFIDVGKWIVILCSTDDAELQQQVGTFEVFCSAFVAFAKGWQWIMAR